MALVASAFALAPGSQATSGVAYEGSLPAGAGPGSSIPAILPGGSHVAFAPHDSLVWLEDALVVLLIGAAMAVALWISPIGMPGRPALSSPRGRLLESGSRTGTRCVLARSAPPSGSSPG
jgi:hypothetical protein